MKLKTRDMILVSLFAALSAVGAINIPIPNVPITLQFFFVALSGILLGSKLGMLSQLVYVAIGLIGVPVFTKGGGPSYIFQPSFGYLIGFILGSFVIGKVIEKLKTINLVTLTLATLLGLAVVYLIGVPYLYMILNLYFGKGMTLDAILKIGLFTSLPSDLVKSAIVVVLSRAILPILKRARLLPNSVQA